MPDSKITDLVVYGTYHSDDLIVVVDTHDTTMSSSGTNKKMTFASLISLAGLVVGPSGSAGQIQYNSSGNFAGAAHLSVGSSGQLNLGAISAPGSPSNGDLWYDAAQGVIKQRQSGVTTPISGCLYSQNTPVTITASGQSSIINTTNAIGTITLPANFLVPGRVLRITIGGTFTSASSGTGTVAMAAVANGTVFGTTGAGAISPSISNLPMQAVLIIACKSAGSTGVVQCSGMYTIATSATGSSTIGFGNGNAVGAYYSTPTDSILNTTGAISLDLVVALSASVNSFRFTNVVIEVIC